MHLVQETSKAKSGVERKRKRKADNPNGKWFFCEWMQSHPLYLWDLRHSHCICSVFYGSCETLKVLNYDWHSSMKCRSSICKNVYILLTDTRVCIKPCYNDELVMCWGIYHVAVSPTMECIIHGMYLLNRHWEVETRSQATTRISRS